MKKDSAYRIIRPAGWAWIGLVAYVAVVDTILLRLHRKRGLPYCTLSEAFGDALKHPIKRFPLIFAWFLLTLHLFGCLIPERFNFLKKLDPIGYLARLLEG